MSAFGKKLRLAENDHYMFWCPGCKTAHGMSVGDKRTDTHWGFNRNPDAPTFTPSVLVTGQTHVPPVTPENLEEWKAHPWPQQAVKTVCHSFVTDGQIQFLGDCTHALAGQTVPLPDFPSGMTGRPERINRRHSV